MDNPRMSDGWRNVAILEAFDRTIGLDALLADKESALRFEPAEKSPPGCAWVDVFINAYMKQSEADLRVGLFLRAMTRVHDAGRLDGFRIGSGQHWIAVSENLEADCAIHSPPAGTISNA